MNLTVDFGVKPHVFWHKESCSCKKTDLRDKRCTPVTCRKCGCFDRNREQTDEDTLSSSSTEFSTDTESDGIAEPLINLRRDFISSDDEY